MAEVSRDIFAEIAPWIGESKVLILRGPRQVGKSTLLRHIEEELRNRGEKFFSYSIDQELDNPLFKSPSNLRNFLLNQSDNKFFYLFLDEFQYLNDSGLFLKALYDSLKGRCQIIVSGSSSLEISKSTEFLTGRKIEFRIETFSFREFLKGNSEWKFDQRFSLKEFKEAEEFNSIYSKELKKHFAEYLDFGGYPEIALEKNNEKKIKLLNELLSTYLQKDVSGFLKISNISAFNNLIRILTSQRGNLLNKSELSSSLNISFETVSWYLDALEGTFLFSFLPPYFSNLRKEISKMPKIYTEDFGIVKYVMKTSAPSSYDILSGQDIETYCFRIFRKVFEEENLFYHRTVSKSEIDFIGRKNSSFIPIEIKFTNKIQRKVTLAMKNFSERYTDVPYFIFITKDTLSWNRESRIFYIPAYLLEFLDILA